MSRRRSEDERGGGLDGMTVMGTGTVEEEV